jgi:hypothetical protein
MSVPNAPCGVESQLPFVFVPNAPCGVESCLKIVNLVHDEIVPNAPCGVERRIISV